MRDDQRKYQRQRRSRLLCRRGPALRAGQPCSPWRTLAAISPRASEPRLLGVQIPAHGGTRPVVRVELPRPCQRARTARQCSSLRRAPRRRSCSPPPTTATKPEVSLVVPALNEENHHRHVRRRCLEGWQRRASRARSSSSTAPTIARRRSRSQHGARVLRTPEDGGSAGPYIDALPFIRGKYVIMGDCDCTYDFREHRAVPRGVPRRARVRHGVALQGDDRSRCDAAAAPVLRDASHDLDSEHHVRLQVQRHPLRHARPDARRVSQAGPAVAEVGVRLRDDHQGGQARAAHRGGAHPLPEGHGGRQSHLKTMWYAPWVAGWQNLRVFFLFRPDFFLRLPGRALFALGALLVFGLAFGPAQIGPVGLALYSQVLGLFMFGVGSELRRARRADDAAPEVRQATLPPVVGASTTTTSWCRCRRWSVVAGAAISSSFVIDWVRRRLQDWPPVARLHRRPGVRAARDAAVPEHADRHAVRLRQVARRRRRAHGAVPASTPSVAPSVSSSEKRGA